MHTDMPTKKKKAETKWPARSAGREMIHDVPVARAGQTVAQVKAMIQTHIRKFSTIIYVYVVDDENHLIGLLSIRELFEQKPSAEIRSVCTRRNLVSVHPWHPRERIAYLALARNLKAVPVIDKAGELLGVVPPDALLRILHVEMHEDQLHMAGIHHRGVHHEQMFDNILKISVWRSLLHRFPWLLLGLGGGLLAAGVIGFFEETLHKTLLLAAFIPLIVYMSDAVGTQMEAFIIRDLAMDRKLRFGAYFLRQFLIVAALGIAFGALLFVSAGLFYGDIRLAGVISFSLFAAIVSSVFTGLIVPYLFSRIRFDPANASGPTATIIQDLLSVIIYFSVATLLL
jgi:magnesium transporter